MVRLRFSMMIVSACEHRAFRMVPMTLDAPAGINVTA